MAIRNNRLSTLVFDFIFRKQELGDTPLATGDRNVVSNYLPAKYTLDVRALLNFKDVDFSMVGTTR